MGLEMNSGQNKIIGNHIGNFFDPSLWVNWGCVFNRCVDYWRSLLKESPLIIIIISLGESP